MTGLRRWTWLLAPAALLAGCVTVPQWEKPGASRTEVLARLGTPTAIHALPNGERLQYSAQPYGTQVHNLDFDASGRLVRVDQVLDPAWFGKIQVDVWTAADVERLLGRPGLVEHVARFDGDIWTYRFAEVWTFRRRLHVHLDRAGVVRQILVTDEVTNDPDRR